MWQTIVLSLDNLDNIHSFNSTFKNPIPTLICCIVLGMISSYNLIVFLSGAFLLTVQFYPPSKFIFVLTSGVGSGRVGKQGWRQQGGYTPPRWGTVAPYRGILSATPVSKAIAFVIANHYLLVNTRLM